VLLFYFLLPLFSIRNSCLLRGIFFCIHACFLAHFLLSNFSFACLPLASLTTRTGTYTTPVKNQGYCGSCWAFSATEQIESDCILQTGTELILAPQQITSCDKTSFGCNGGLTERAYDYVIRAGGIENETEYPYTSGECASEERISVCAF